MSLSLLAALIVVAATAGSSRLHSGIAGRVVEGPTCPVETVPPSPQCAPRPIRATIRIQHVGSHGPGWTVRSAGDGRFRVRLAPATYLITPLRHHDSSFPRPPAPFRVRVRRDHFTSVTIEYDTGIR